MYEFGLRTVLIQHSCLNIMLFKILLWVTYENA